MMSWTGIRPEGMPGGCEGATQDWMDRQRGQQIRQFSVEIVGLSRRLR